jgi:O-methyltransferase involved in polyketide biosynthesis
MTGTEKNYSSISPSAAFLIQLKAYTTIPFAKEAAALLEKENPGMAQYILQRGIKQFFRGLIHFENRYRTIEKMLSHLNAKNILEISSGYSLRGLALCRDNNIHFIDTDLPEVIAAKQKMIETVSGDISLKGSLELLSLNALDEKHLKTIITRFPEGPVTIINEGLLMYLGQEEKTKLCSIIHEALSQRGGQWITADVYIKKKEKEAGIIDENEYARKFSEEHHIEENKFDDYPEAEIFFNDCGFKIVNKEIYVTEELSCLQLLSGEQRNNVIEKLKNSSSHHETWELEIK